MVEQPRRSGIVRALGNRNYRIYASGNAVSLTGTWVQRVAVGWLTWQLTESATWLGLIAMAELFPSLLVSPLAGAAADRLDRIRLTKICQCLQLTQAVTIAALTLGGLITVELLFALTVVLGTVGAFNQPSRLSLVNSMVGRDDISAAVALNSVLWNAARFIGPAIAGVIIVVFGIGYAFLANALSYLAFLLALTMIDLPAGTATTRRGQSLVTQIVEGFKYACGHPGIGPLLLLMIATALLARPFTELLPGFADRVFERGAVGLATLTSVTGIGAIIGGLWLGQRGDVTGLTRIAVINIAVFALSLLAFTATDSFPVALVSVLFAGFSMVVSGISSQTLIQISAQGPMLGRVLSLYGLTWRAGPALGALIMGSLADSLGMRWPVAGGATLCLVGWVFAMRHRQRLAALLESEPPEDC